MYKFFVIAAFIAVAFAQDEAKTKAQCTTDLGADCAVCVGDKLTSAECEAAQNGDDFASAISCGVLAECYSEAVEIVEEEAKKETADKIASFVADFCPKTKKECKDSDAYCATWAKEKECSANPDWMFPNCPKSCCPICTDDDTIKAGTCPEEKTKDQCKSNTDSQCHPWAIKGECDANPSWMKRNCMQSCCDVCKTSDTKCPTVKETCKNSYGEDDAEMSAEEATKKCKAWAQAGECKANSMWMNSKCSKECCIICAPAPPGPVPRSGSVQLSGLFSTLYNPSTTTNRVVQQQPPIVYNPSTTTNRVVQQQPPIVQAAPRFGGYSSLSAFAYQG